MTAAEARQVFRLVFEPLCIGTALIECSGNWLKVNQTLCKLCGYSEDELLASTLQDMIPPDSLQPDLSALDRFRSGDISHYGDQKRMLDRRGNRIPIFLELFLLGYEGDKPKFCIVQLDDLRDRPVPSKPPAENIVAMAGMHIEHLIHSEFDTLPDPIPR